MSYGKGNKRRERGKKKKIESSSYFIINNRSDCYCLYLMGNYTCYHLDVNKNEDYGILMFRSLFFLNPLTKHNKWCKVY